MIFWKKVTEQKIRVWILSANLSEKFPVLRRIQRDIIINVHRSSLRSTRYPCHILMKFEFSGQIFEKYSKDKKFQENPSSASSYSMWTDGDTDMISQQSLLPILRTRLQTEAVPFHTMTEYGKAEAWVLSISSSALDSQDTSDLQPATRLSSTATDFYLPQFQGIESMRYCCKHSGAISSVIVTGASATMVHAHGQLLGIPYDLKQK
jgi:hypothetical protein